MNEESRIQKEAEKLLRSLGSEDAENLMQFAQQAHQEQAADPVQEMLAEAFQEVADEEEAADARDSGAKQDDPKRQPVGLLPTADPNAPEELYPEGSNPVLADDLSNLDEWNRYWRGDEEEEPYHPPPQPPKPDPYEVVVNGVTIPRSHVLTVQSLIEEGQAKDEAEAIQLIREHGL